MIRDAETNQEADALRKTVVESKNELDSLIHSVEKNLAEHGNLFKSIYIETHMCFYIHMSAYTYKNIRI
jgi:molecular chaperone DnaK (HSP70)